MIHVTTGVNFRNIRLSGKKKTKGNISFSSLAIYILGKKKNRLQRVETSDNDVWGWEWRLTTSGNQGAF